MLHTVLFPLLPQPRHHFKLCLLDDLLFSIVSFFSLFPLFTLAALFWNVCKLTSYLLQYCAPKPATTFQWYFSNTKCRCNTALQDLSGIFLVMDPRSTSGVMMEEPHLQLLLIWLSTMILHHVMLAFCFLQTVMVRVSYHRRNTAVKSLQGACKQGFFPSICLKCTNTRID